MRLGKIINMDKFIFKDNHWQHPDIKENQEYIIKHTDSPWLIGTFKHFQPPYHVFWQFTPNFGGGCIQLSYGENPNINWFHIQEFIGDKE